MYPLLSASRCSITSSHFPLAFPGLPVLRFGTTALTSARKLIGRGVAVATPEVALFFEVHSHGNMEDYATLANTHSDSLPSCLCPARQLHHLSSSTWDTWGQWPRVKGACLLFQTLNHRTSKGKLRGKCTPLTTMTVSRNSCVMLENRVRAVAEQIKGANVWTGKPHRAIFLRSERICECTSPGVTLANCFLWNQKKYHLNAGRCGQKLHSDRETIKKALMETWHCQFQTYSHCI